MNPSISIRVSGSVNSLPSPSVTGPMRSGMNSLNLKFRPHQEIVFHSRKASRGGDRGRKLNRAGARARHPSLVGVRRDLVRGNVQGRGRVRSARRRVQSRGRVSGRKKMENSSLPSARSGTAGRHPRSSFAPPEVQKNACNRAGIFYAGRCCLLVLGVDFKNGFLNQSLNQ